MILKVQISKTRDGNQDYMQIMSDDLLSVNIVLVADKIEIGDDRWPSRSALLKEKKKESRP